MADLNTMQSPDDNNHPKIGKGLIIGIIIAVVVILALMLFWPSGSNDVEQTTPGTDLNTGVGTEGNVPPANEGAFPEVNDGLNIEF